MNLSVNSVIMAIIWCDIFVVFSYLIIKRNGFLLLNVFPITALLFISLLRLVISVELPFATVIRSQTIYNSLLRLMTLEIFKWPSGGSMATVGDLLIIIWTVGSVIAAIYQIICYRKDYVVINSWTIERDVEAEAILYDV